MSIETFMQSYLVAYIAWMTLTLGCFGLLLLHHVVRGRWGLPILRMLEAGSKTLPLMLIGFVPIALSLRRLYWWTTPARYSHDGVLMAKLWYLNTPGWLVRAALCFAVWIGVTTALTRWTAREDRTGDARLAQKRTDLSAPGIVLYFVTVTIAATDWVMSIEPHWSSSIFGAWFVTNQALAAMSFVVLLLLASAHKKPYEGLITPELTRDLGNMLLAMTLLWAYISFSQYIIIWSANLPDDAGYFVKRLHGGWDWVGTAMVVGQFFVPFLLLLSTALKRSVRMLGSVAALLLATSALNVLWAVAPAFPDQAAHSVVLDVVLMAAMGVVWLGWFAVMRRRSAPLPAYDPRLTEVVTHA